MKKILLPIVAAVFAFVSCEEFEPVFTGSYPAPEEEKTYTEQEALALCGVDKVMKIAQLTAKYTNRGAGFEFKERGMIAGRVSTTDQPGNFYKTLYIQDETGGIELKIGRNGLYNSYHPGQMLYVDLKGLFIGCYGDGTLYGEDGKSKGTGYGMVQIGYNGEGTDYETAYFQVPLLIDSHILKGSVADITPVRPDVLSSSQLPAQTATHSTCPYLGKLVTLKGLKYDNRVFVLLYLDSMKDKKASSNRIFISNASYYDRSKWAWGITTWAMSKQKMTSYLLSGQWDELRVGNTSDASSASHILVRSLRGDGTYPTIEKNAYSVSQYFKMDNTPVIVRTSGYSKFADREMPSGVIDGTKTIDVTGVLTLYQGSIQIVVNNISDIVVDGKPLQ